MDPQQRLQSSVVFLYRVHGVENSMVPVSTQRKSRTSLHISRHHSSILCTTFASELLQVDGRVLKFLMDYDIYCHAKTLGRHY